MQKKAKLSKFTRLTVYSYLDTTELFLKIGLLDSTTRENLSGSGIACSDRSITINIPNSVFNCDNCQVCEKEEQHPLITKYMVTLISHVTIRLNSTYRESKHRKLLEAFIDQYKPNNTNKNLSLEVHPSKFGQRHQFHIQSFLNFSIDIRQILEKISLIGDEKMKQRID